MRIQPLWVIYATLIILMTGGSLLAEEGDLTINSVTPGNNQAGATTIYTFNITTSLTGNGSDVGIPPNGWIFITFPASFDLSDVELAQAVAPGMTGGFDDVSVVTSTIKLHRDNSGNNVPGNTPVSFKVGNIKNASSGVYTVSIITKTNGGTNIDNGTYNSLNISTGSLSYIKIENAPNSSGTEIGNYSTTADQSITMYAAGYDALDNYLGDQSVSWSVSGNIGNISPGTGISTVLTLTTTGVGQVSADNGSGVIDYTGNITVSAGALSQVRIVEGESGAGSELTTRTLTTDQSLTVHAAGYDLDGNYTGDESVTWQVTNGIGQVSSSPAVLTTFDATTVGTGRIQADHATANDDETGDITINNGNLNYVKIVAGASGDGAEYTTNSIQAGQSFTVHAAGYDADHNYIADQNVNWAVGNGIGTANPSTNVSSTLFTGTTNGTGWIKADHSTATDDVTDEIMVSPGSLDNLKIRTGSQGIGRVLSNTDTLLYINEDLTLYSAGYDAYDNYISDVSGTWNKTGDLDFSGPIDASTITFNPQIGETSGKIYVEKPGVESDTTGTITISGISSIKLTTSVGPTATELNAHTMSVDDSLVLYASAYDSRGNYLDTVSVDWSLQTKDTVINVNSNQFIFSPLVAPDTVKIYGAFGVVAEDSTGNIYIKAGAPASDFVIVPNVNELTADGIDLTRVTSDTIFDKYGNKILPNELFTISVSPQNLGTGFGTLFTDQDLNLPGHQVKSDLDGQITFEIQAGTKGGTAFVSATSVTGTAYGDTSIILSAIRARQISIINEKVSQGQDSIEVSFLVQNLSPNEISSFTADLKFSTLTGTKLNGYFDVLWDSVDVILPQQSKTLKFWIDVASNTPIGNVIVDGRISGVVAGTTTLQDTAVGITDTILVQQPPVLNIVSVTAPKDTVEQGTNNSVYLSVENIGEADAIVYADSIIFSLKQPPFTNLTKDYSQISNPSNPDTIYAGDPPVILGKNVTVGANSTEGQIVLDGKIIVQDANSGKLISHQFADVTDEWVVEKKGEISVTDFFHNQQSVILGQTTPWTVTMKIQNNFDTTNVALDSARLDFYAGTDLITSEFIVNNPVHFQEFSNSDTLFADTTETLIFTVNKTSESTIGKVRIIGTAYLSDVAQTQLLATGEDQINIQSASDLIITSVEPTVNEATTRQDKDWKVRVVVKNTGTSDIVVDFSSDLTYIDFSTGSDFKVINPENLILSGDSLLSSGLSDTLYFTIDSTGYTPGESQLNVNIAYADINALEDKLTVTNNLEEVTIESKPNIRIIETTNVAPNAPYVDTNQNFRIAVIVENAGDDGVHGVKLKMSSDSLSTINDLNVFSIAGNSIDTAYFDINAFEHWTKDEIFTTEIDTAIGDNTSEFDNSIISPVLDNTDTAIILRPASIDSIKIVPSENPLEALSKNWYVNVHVWKSGGGSVRFNPPHKDSLKFYIDGELQTDYFITAPENFYGSDSLTFPEWAAGDDYLNFVINQGGLLGGAAFIEVTLTGTYLNNDSSFVIRDTGYVDIETTAALRIISTDPVCPHIEDGVGILSTEQQFKVKVAITNSGEEPVDSVWVRLGSNSINYAPDTLMLDSISSKGERYLEFNHIAKLDEERIEFDAEIISAKSRLSGGSALIGSPYDSVAVFQVQNKADLSVRFEMADTVMTLNEISPLRFIVENNGNAETDLSGKVTINLPDNYKIQLQSGIDSIATTRSYTMNQWETLEVIPPDYISEDDIFTITISKIPDDLNTAFPAYVSKYQDEISVKTVPSDMTITTQLVWPDGAKDSVVSTEQYFDLQSTFDISDNINNVQATIVLPEGYIFNSGEVATKNIQSGIVKWRIKAPTTDHLNKREIVINATGEVGVTQYAKSDTFKIIAEAKAFLNLENVRIISPPQTDSTLSINQELTISATVINDGMADVIGQGTLSIDFGATGITTEQDTIKPFTVDNPVTWIARAPANITGNSRITVKIEQIPFDENVNDVAYAPGNRRSISVKTVKAGSITIEDFRITDPIGAFDQVLSTSQEFTIQAQISWTSLDGLPTASVQLPEGFTTEILDKNPVGTLTQGVVTWVLKAPAEAVATSDIWIKATGSDNNSGGEIEIISENIQVDVVQQAEVSLNAVISDPPDAVDGIVLSTGQSFTIMANLLKTGDAAIDDFYKVRLTLPPGQGYITDDALDPRVGANETVYWTITAPLSARDANIFTVKLIEPPQDENTNKKIDGDAIIEDSRPISVTTQEKSVSLSILPRRSNRSVAKGDTCIPMLGLQMECSGNDASNSVRFQGVTLKLKDKFGDLIENPNTVISRIAVVKYAEDSVVYGELTSIPETGPLTIEFEAPTLIVPGDFKNIEFEVDISANATVSDFQVTIDSSKHLDLVDAGSLMRPKIYFDGESSENLSISSGFSVIVPKKFNKAFWNYPNPFGSSERPTTTIQYYLDEEADVEIRIFTLFGELVWSKKYSRNEPQGRKGLHDGSSAIIWDARNDNGRKVLNGVYVATITASYGKSAMTKIAVLK